MKKNNAVKFPVMAAAVALGSVMSLCGLSAGQNANTGGKAPGTAAESARFAPPTELVGRWKGSAYIVVTWCKEKNLPMELSIKPDGSVEGHVGDAVIKDAHVEKNRGELSRALGLFSDYLIRAGTDGYLVERESISREKISIPFHMENGVIKGTVLGIGKKIGDKNTMMFTADNLVLAKTASGTQKLKAKEAESKGDKQKAQAINKRGKELHDLH